MHSEELRNIYSSPYVTRVTKIEENEMGRAWNTHSVDNNLLQNYDQEDWLEEEPGRPRY
jgi:hypothetical protein